MFVVCKNDYPWFVCPEDTTEVQAQYVRKIKQIEVDKDCTQNHTKVYVHVQVVDMLSDTQMNALLSRTE